MSRSFSPRRVLVSLALGMAVIVAAGLSAFGLSYRDSAPLFILFFLAPCFIGLLSAALALFPRVVQINLLVFVCFWLSLEIVFGVLRHGRPQVRETFDAGFFHDDPILGYAISPNCRAHWTGLHGQERYFAVTLNSDEAGRRETPVAPRGPRSKFLLFFGDSQTFGNGIEDSQTLPFYAGEMAPSFHPYNYAVSGWGPAQTLDLLAVRNLSSEIRERQGYAFFGFIADHLPRVVGSSDIDVRGSWGRHFSCYSLDRDGNLERDGDFVHAHPFTTLFYEAMHWSSVASYLGVVLPLHYSDQDYRLTAAIIRKSRDLLEARLKLEGFYVVILPAKGTELRRCRRMMKALNSEGVKYLDFTGLYDPNDPAYILAQYDPHSTALANRLIAEQLVSTLGIGALGIQSSRK